MIYYIVYIIYYMIEIIYHYISRIIYCILDIEDASRDHRPLKSISADVLLRRLQMSFQDGLCNVVHVLRVPSRTKT